MVVSKIRTPAVAGQFYPAAPKELVSQIQKSADWNQEKVNAIGCILPHAGYMYSGQVACRAVASIKLKDNIIILGPNHTGYGELFSIMPEGVWQTPLGDVDINTSLAREILKKSNYFKEDMLAHKYEHSIEVQLPILQFAKKDFKFVPMVIGVGDVQSYKEAGREIAETLKDMKLNDSCTIIASSDMTHYEPQGSAEKKDGCAIEAILKLDEDKLWQVAKKFDITMCGLAPVIIMLSAAKYLGGSSAKLIKYQTSGDVTGDYSSVVGYAGITIH